jgi:hypothetical protein
MIEHLRQLLAVENSDLGRLLWFSLYGLEATLSQALNQYPFDPGIQECDRLIQELQLLLQPVQPQPVFQPEPVNEFQLAHLVETFDLDPDVNFYLDGAKLQSRLDADVWMEIHRKLLRLPEDLATFWQQRALDLAQEVGAIADYQNLLELPFVRDEVIYPGLSGVVEAQGLCLSHKALLHSELFQNHPSEDVDLQLLIGFILLYIKFMQIDPDLHHALKTVFSFDTISLQDKPEQRHQYIEALGDRWQRVQKAQANSDTISHLRTWIDMDEAIHSLLFIPPAERYSWWGKLQQESRRILKKVADRAIKAGNNVRIRQLSGLYADICAFSKDDLQLDCGGTPGEVLTCLRVYARINQEENPGRVIFRSSR